jgi:hypothetical protein
MWYFKAGCREADLVSPPNVCLLFKSKDVAIDELANEEIVDLNTNKSLGALISLAS